MQDKVHTLMSDFNLMDCWRESNIEKKEYTWFRRNPIKKYTDVVNARILPGYRTDHSLILISFQFGKFQKGRSYWKFNNSLLKDEVYIEQVKNVIKETKIQYATNILENNKNINDVDIEELRFSINNQLFF
jgi:hypothetical protein